MTPNLAPTFQPLTGLYEPSAIQRLPDGRFLVVEDEKDHSFSLLTLSASGDVSSKSLGPAWFHGGDPIWKLDDLEGLALDGAGNLYASTSHSRDDGDHEHAGRYKVNPRAAAHPHHSARVNVLGLPACRHLVHVAESCAGATFVRTRFSDRQLTSSK